MPKTSKIYVGHKKGSGEIFKSTDPDSPTNRRKYQFVTGPFKTLKAAKAYMNKFYGRY